MREISAPALEEAGTKATGAGEVYVEVPEDEILDGQVVGDLMMPDVVHARRTCEEEEPVLEVAGEEVSEKPAASEAEALTEEKKT